MTLLILSATLSATDIVRNNSLIFNQQSQPSEDKIINNNQVDQSEVYGFRTPQIFGKKSDNEIIDQMQIKRDNCWIFRGGHGMVSQGFKPNVSKLTKVQMILERFGDPSGHIEISISSSKNPSDSITSTTIQASDLEEGDQCTTWVEFDFRDRNVDRNETYYIIFDPLGASNWDWYNNVGIGAGENNPYKRGTSWWFYSSAGWHEDEDEDLCFKLFGINTPPDTPQITNGSINGEAGAIYYFSSVATDQDSHKIKYGWDWNDNDIVDEWTDLHHSGVQTNISHSWSIGGTYNIQVKSEDSYEAQSDFSNFFTINITGLNDPPSKPLIDGPSSGIPEKTYNYTFSSSDPENSPVYFYIEWGDGNQIEWTGPFSSGEEIILNHSWAEKERYIIKTKTRDIHDLESDWAALEVSLSKNKIINTLFIRLLEQHPRLFTLLRQILGV